VSAAEPLYVIETKPTERRVVIGRNDELLRASMQVQWRPTWISVDPPPLPICAEVKSAPARGSRPATHRALGPQVIV